MTRLRLSTVGAVCAIAAVVCFVVGVAAMASSGVQVLIPETGHAGREWIADVDSAGGLFLGGAWLIILMGLLAIVAYLGFYDMLRHAGPVMVLVPVLGSVGLTLVTVSHLIPIAMAYELVPAYTGSGPVAHVSLAAIADTLASTALVTNTAGNFLGWGVATPLVAVAILSTRALPRWLGWFGLLVGLLAGWLGLLSPVSGVFEAISTLGFVGFFAFVLSMGISMLMRLRRTAEDRAGVSA